MSSALFVLPSTFFFFFFFAQWFCEGDQKIKALGFLFFFVV